MNTTSKLLQNDPETLKALDERFLAEYAAGTLPEIDVPPLDPASDPFGRGFDWLRAPEMPYEAAIEKLAARKPDDWYRAGGAELRAAALAGSLAAGTDDQVYRAWAESRFLAVCHSDGDYGRDLLNRLQSDEPVDDDLVYGVATVLEAHPAFARLSHEQRVAAALIAIEAIRPPARPS